MKTLYVTVYEWIDIAEWVDRYRGAWGGGQSPEVATHKALQEVLGHEVAEKCLEGARIEIVTKLPVNGGVKIRLDSGTHLLRA
jgi:hypothetical protein